MPSDDARPSLYPGERIATVAGTPCLLRFFPANRKLPLVVAIPGGAHNARIYYGGHDGYEPRDFIAPWLVDSGFGVLAISYPLESEPGIMPATAPMFRITDWGQQAAEATKQLADEHHLCGDVVLVAWSMGGRLLVPYAREARRLGLNVKLFVSLAASPGLPGVRLGPPETKMTPAGYATLEAMVHLFMNQIHGQEALNNHKTIIPEQVFRAEYFGALPVGLLGWGIEHDGQGGIVRDEWGHIRDASAHSFSDMPWMACLVPMSQLDARHSLSDRASWGYLMTQRLTNMLVGLPQMEPIRWTELVDFVQAAPAKLSEYVLGNHYFFIGQTGAKATAAGILRMLATADSLQSELDSILQETWTTNDVHTSCK